MKANILILNTQVPFTSGGAEALVERLCAELKKRDFRVDTVALPFSALPKKRIAKEIAIWRALDLESFSGRKVDLVIGTKFPSYLAYHPNKVIWLIHQHRQAYELYGTRFGDFGPNPEDEALRQMIMSADRKAFEEASLVCAISPNVAGRLGRYMGVEARVLTPPPPLDGRYRKDTPEDFILYVGRICSIKRLDLVIRALPSVSDRLCLKVVGLADEPSIGEYIQSEIEKHHIRHRVEMLGRVSDEELISLYARAFCVFYAPFDEDYGFVTLEALKSGCPVVTASDSGSVLDFVEHEVNGLIAVPKVKAVAAALNRLLEEEDLYQNLRDNTSGSTISSSWDEICRELTSSIPKS